MELLTEKLNIQDLPSEIVLKIFDYLKSPDVFKISEVCKSWCNIAQHPSFVNNSTVELNSLENNPFLKSRRKFNFKLRINNHLLPDENYVEFKDKFRDQIIEIEFEEIYLPILDILRKYLENLNNLKSLRFYACRFGNYKTYPDEVLSLDTVTSLRITGTLLEDAAVPYILSLTPNLKLLSVNSSRSSDDCREAIENFLKNQELTKSLRELNIHECELDIFQITHLDLDSFYWHSCRGAIEPVEAVETFLTHQTNLKTLKLNVNPSFLTQVIRICSVHSIEELHFNCHLASNMMRNVNFEPFWNLKTLVLDSADSDSALFKGLTKTSKMESLTLRPFFDEMLETKILDKFKFLPNLKVFDLMLGFLPISSQLNIHNFLLQAIFKDLVNLRELCLEDLAFLSVSGRQRQRTDEYDDGISMITDFGITGYRCGFPMARLSKLEKFVLITNTDGITNKSVKHIESMKSLRANKVLIRKSRNAQSTRNPIFYKGFDYL